MKKLRVTASPGGRIVPYRREGQIPPIDDGWWESVLADTRRRDLNADTRIGANSPYVYLRLDRQHGPEIVVNCPCGLSGIFNKAHLIQHLGGDANIQWLAKKLIDCGRRNKISNGCHAYCLR